ncbi:Transcriptional regulatory protein moc3 [Fusarium oxysporum f. sp. albedinis]|nr:Transcriptional regulatory protein moc3 [Fusarium oxysporum f. sp. albedinis]
MNVPFNNPSLNSVYSPPRLVSSSRPKAPAIYEILEPEDLVYQSLFVHPTSRLNGWDAIKSRVGQLDLETTD